VLVTGANRGIGRELARQLALRGGSVVLAAPIATVLSTRARGSAIT
jgi:NAD(P)-dependent dehydrogenase (short-subunit alcohol dehydrogenase family)